MEVAVTQPAAFRQPLQMFQNSRFLLHGQHGCGYNLSVQLLLMLTELRAALQLMQLIMQGGQLLGIHGQTPGLSADLAQQGAPVNLLKDNSPAPFCFNKPDRLGSADTVLVINI
ncbi:hypothetical protein D3C71_1827360 [compost metagenome]